MSDPYYSLMKAEKRECDWLYAVADANYGILTKCACGQPIGVETGEQGRHYYVCKQYEEKSLALLVIPSAYLSWSSSRSSPCPSSASPSCPSPSSWSSGSYPLWLV
ncbi:hypothetical protein F2Q70_00022068 [Brassica cretica]|uniref:Uncharacterized protein n=2 Tax=Brassica cretica TaxID=69181 RepID=A0A8S9GPW4_BRACR|nr:hypothetical protein F2Q70_00022068 [Brassica cretica]KAF2556488.1 hypothetical protein F2Q68_00015870 [Brassica cretica]KAF3609152.1 hypothetical protein DY000_02048421 [Brassica cretica]